MFMKKVSLLFIIIMSCCLNRICFSDWSGEVGLETRYFTQSAFTPQQDYRANVSLYMQPEYVREWDDGHQVFAFVPFLRIDQHDSERSHFDVRELTWLKASENWELRLGVRKVFWGVIEFNHLVDIINQTDLVENVDGEDKLGQPMVNLALIRDWGTIDLFVMPWFRERTFPGTHGRFRSQPVVADDMAKYESPAGQHHVDFAIRYSHYFGDWDIGISDFYGTSREPELIPDFSGPTPVLVPYYSIINQASLDLQVTKGQMLYKLEALHRSGQDKTFNAMAAGFEYTFTRIFDTESDLGILGEYHYDSRGDSAPTIFNHDFAIGSRVTLNDENSSTILIGLLIDKNNGGKFFNLESSRRFGNNWLLKLQARIPFDQIPADPAFAISRDDFLEMEFSYNF